MKVLVTGGAGYLGSVLVAKLVARRHTVRVLDIGYFGLGHLRVYQPPVEIIREDIRVVLTDRNFAATLMDGVDCVIHLAAISNDPSAELNPALTTEVNYEATIVLAEEAKRRGIRFLFSSSCSVYGEIAGQLDETAPLNPLTVYASSKVESERVLEELADDSWSPVILRNGTLFGFSVRMRFDLVVNIFSLYSTLYDEIKVFGDGRQWRPFLHVTDCARAFMFFAELRSPRHRTYNIAHENQTVMGLAEHFKSINPRLKVTRIELENEDRRDYRVSTVRAETEGYFPRVSIALGADEMIEAIITGLIADPESTYHRNAKWLKELTDIGSKGHREIVTFIEALSRTRR